MQHVKRAWAEINLDHLAHNFRQIKTSRAPGVRVMSVVKANAYGHGEKHAALTLQKCGSDWFGVSNILEARNLRRYGVTKPILVLGYTPENSARDLYELSLTQCVFEEGYAERLAEAARREQVVIDVHLKMDTGMNRLGFDTHEVEDLIMCLARVCYLPNLRVTGVFTHFAAADDPSDQGMYYTALQHRRFMTVMTELDKRGFQFRDVHCSNSAALMRYPEFDHTMIRPGISLYGLAPDGKKPALDLRPVMALKCVVAMVKEVRAGEKISYGCTYEAYENMRVATLPIGYADGFPRALSNRGFAFADDKIVPIVGRICMDQMMIDVTGLDVREGDAVTLFGGDSPIGADNVAGIAGTINYEITCGISRRVERVFLSAGKVIDAVDFSLSY